MSFWKGFITGLVTMYGLIYLIWKGGNTDNDPGYLSKFCPHGLNRKEPCTLSSETTSDRKAI